MKILVVDDEMAVAELLASILAADGHVLSIAPDGAVALGLVATRAFDLILSDVRMPDLDGPGLYREIGRVHPHLLHRFVFLTGDPTSPDVSDYLARSPAPMLAKPFDPGQVRRLVARYDEASRAPRR